MTTQEIRDQIELLEIIQKGESIKPVMISDSSTNKIWPAGDTDRKISMQDFEKSIQYSPLQAIAIIPHNKR